MNNFYPGQKYTNNELRNILIARFEIWTEARAELAEADDAAPTDWHDSDDEAISLMNDMGVFLTAQWATLPDLNDRQAVQAWLQGDVK